MRHPTDQMSDAGVTWVISITCTQTQQQQMLHMLCLGSDVFQQGSGELYLYYGHS
jgi:hypothetical protein